MAGAGLVIAGRVCGAGRRTGRALKALLAAGLASASPSLAALKPWLGTMADLGAGLRVGAAARRTLVRRWPGLAGFAGVSGSFA